MIRVYCKNCKYLDTDYSKINNAHSCYHHSVARVRVTHSWYETTTVRRGGDPVELNKDNNCHYYEEKNES